MLKHTIIAAAIAAAGTSAAQDLNPPPFVEGRTPYTAAEGADNLLFAHYTFSAGLPSGFFLQEWSTLDPVADGSSLNPLYTPPALVTGSLTNLNGSTPGIAYIFRLPNWLDDRDRTDLRIQMVWENATGPDEEQPIVQSILGYTDDGATQSVGTRIATAGFVEIDASTFAIYEDWVTNPSTDYHDITVFVPQGTTLRELYFDTQSVNIPAHGSMALIGVAGAFSLRRRSNTHA